MCCHGSKLDNLPKDENGVIDFRKQSHGCCRDFYCLIAFILAVVGMIIIFVLGFGSDPRKLYYPLDNNGMYCGMENDYNGIKSDLTKRPLFLYFCLLDLSLGVCVESCPNSTHYCVKEDGTYIPDVESKVDCKNNPLSLYSNFAKDGWIEELLEKKDIVSTLFDYYKSKLDPVDNTIELMNRCVPNVPEVLDKMKAFSDEFDFGNIYTAFINDLSKGYPLIIINVGITLVVSFLVFLFLQCFAKCIVWCIIIVAIFLFTLVGIFALYYGVKNYKEALPADQTSSKILIAFGICVLVATLLIFLIIIGLRKRISLAATVVQESSRTIRNNCCVLLVPIVYTVLFIGGVVLLLVTMVYYFASLDMDRTNGERKLIFKKETRYIVIYTVLVFFWWTYFMIGMNQYTIGYVGAQFYFSRSTKDRLWFPVFNGVKTLVLHHMGSIAVGSFFIALVATIRTILLYMAKKAKESKSEALAAILACVQCVLGCVQKFLEFIASRAYIMMAIHGQNFWVSAVDALKLMVNNPVRTFFMTGISKFMIIIGELMVVGFSLLITFFILRPDFFVDDVEPPFKVLYWWFILFICFFVSFFITVIIFAIYEFLTDTIFMCFLQDEFMEMTFKNDWQTYASDELRQYMDVKDENAEGAEKGHTYRPPDDKNKEKELKEQNEVYE